MPKVCLEFVGHIEVEVDADPEDVGAWAEAISEAWEGLSAVRKGDAAELVETEIVE